MDQIIARAKEDMQRIVLPEGTEPRTLTAADKLIADKVVRPILLGKHDEIIAKAKELGLTNIEKSEIINPVDSKKRASYVDLLVELRKSKGLTREEAEKLVNDPLYYGCLMVKAGDADGFYINDSSYIITTMLPTMEDYFAALSNIRRSDTYYYPSEEVIDEFAEGPVYKVAPEYYFFRSYLTRKLDGDEEKAEALISELFVICARDADDAQVIAFINDKGIKFDDDDDKKRFMYLYTCWGYELRIWQCKGYKPSELRVEKLENRNFCRPELGDPKKIKLTGRNDECPCGSGKKYKKCCMKYAE